MAAQAAAALLYVQLGPWPAWLPFMLRRTKTEVLSDLPPKIIQDYHCDLSAVQQRLYNDFAAKQKAGEMVQDALASAASSDAHAQGKVPPDQQAAKQPAEGGSATHIFQALQYLRKLANHPKLVLTAAHPQMDAVSTLLPDATAASAILRSPAQF